MKNIEITSEFKNIFDLINDSDKSVFLTGKAGTGKSSLLDYFRENTSKNIAVLASTGVAAVNVKGQTIHSFFKFKANVTLEDIKAKRKKKSNMYKRLDAIVIDEVSMVRADLLDCIDKFLRLNRKDSKSPFGGVQMIFVGDLYQLPPVVTSKENIVFSKYYETPYFFSANCFKDFEFEKV